jgi:ATP-dependent exoDNAse (exonuclease V) beta subunit
MAKAKSALDPSQERAVEERGTAVVRAGAGSGKTRVLAARYARLVKEGSPLESVLALTFTKKAAGEMRSRIRDALRDDPDETVRSRAASFDRAEISTFDSFCARVARSGCGRWGLSPDFVQDEDARERLVSAEAFSFILERRRSAAFRALVSANGFSGLQEGVLGMASRRMTPSSPVDFASMPELCRRELDPIAAEGLAPLAGLRASVLEDAGKGVTMDGLRALLAPALPPWPGEAAPVLALLDSLMGVAARGKSGSIALFSEWKKGPGPAAAKALAALEGLPLYGELCALLEEFQERVLAAKRGAGILGYHDVAVMARDVLRDDLELRAFYKERFGAVMVDEFQDDNALQKEILYLVCERRGSEGKGVPGAGDLEPGKLFFVGDEKQSIYRFRGADVSVFRSLAKELGLASSDLSLSRNYRSSPDLVAFFNALFPIVMAGASEPWEAEYLPVEAAVAPGPGSKVVLLSPEEDSADADGEDDYDGDADGDEAAASPSALGGGSSQAWAIAEYIRESVEGREPLLVRSGPEWRPARYGDFAVLIRSSNRQAPLERFFRLEGIPYAAQDLCGFWSDAPANDILAALRAAAYPEDRNALAAFLRSPFARLGDDAVSGILIDALPPGEWKEAVRPEEADKAERAAATLEEIRGMADSSSLTDIVYALWHEKGYRDFVLRRPRNRSFAEYFEYAFALARRSDEEGAGLAGFIARLEESGAKEGGLKDIDPPRESREGVRIMTVHKAKGLEFPVVILPDMEYGGGDRNSANPAYFTPEGLIAARMAKGPESRGDVFYDRSKALNDAQTEAEAKRLLYVACTRAESRLVLARAPRGRASTAASFWAHISPALDDPLVSSMVERRTYPSRTLGEYLALGRGSEGGLMGAAELETGLKAAGTASWEPERREFAVTEVNAAHIALQGESARRRTGEGGAEAEKISGPAFGILVHELIRAALDSGGGPGSGRAAPLGEAAMKALASIEGGDAAERDARALAEEFLQSDLARRALASGTMRTEAAFLLGAESPAGPAVLKGAIDLSFIEGGTCVVIDYKTDIERVSGAYDAQVSIYMEAARELSGAGRVEGYVFWLRAGGPERARGGVDPGPAIALLMEQRGRIM